MTKHDEEGRSFYHSWLHTFDNIEENRTALKVLYTHMKKASLEWIK